MAYIPPNPNGQATKANSAPVVFASDQAASIQADATNFALMVGQSATNFAFSTVNSTSAQLASAATFTGTIESVINQQSYSILLTSDQPGTLTLNQFIDAGGTRLAQTTAFAITAGTPFARSGAMNGNYAQVVFQNTGGSTTTTLRIDTAYGTIPSATALNNAPSAINEVNGSAISLGQKASTAALPVVFSNDQSQIPVINSQALIMSAPTTNSMAALNAAVQYTVEANSNYYITLTNSAAATTAWVGTSTFQSSVNGGSTWQSLTAMPVALPASSANVTTATANGLWLVESPAGVGSQQVLIRATLTAYTSGTVNFFVSPQTVNQSISMPWIYSVTSGATLVGPIEASNINEISIQLSAVTTTVLTAQGTNDSTGTTWQTIPVQDVNGTVAAGTMTAALTYRFVPSGYRWVRLQVTTTGTVLTVQGVSAKLGQVLNLSSTGSSVNAVIASGTVTTVSTVTAVTSVTAVAALNSVATTNGLSIGTVVTAATPAANSIKATAGRLMHISVGNPNAAIVYLNIFNVAAPTLGTTAANMKYLIPASSQTTIPINDVGLFFSTAIVTSVSGGVSLTDNTAISAGCLVSYSWI